MSQQQQSQPVTQIEIDQRVYLLATSIATARLIVANTSKRASALGARHSCAGDGELADSAIREGADDLVHRPAHQGKLRDLPVTRRQQRRQGHARLPRAARQWPVPGGAHHPQKTAG